MPIWPTALTVSRAWSDRGKQGGLFRPDADAVDAHLLISSFCFFRVSSQRTFGVLFGCDLSDPALRQSHKKMLADAVLNMLMIGPCV